MTFLNELAEKINKTAVEHGFWEADRNMGEMIALQHSELSEALEEHRAGNPHCYFKIAMPNDRQLVEAPHPVVGVFRKIQDKQQINELDYQVLVEAGYAKPEGAGVEIADCIIRLLDTLQSLNIDIDGLVREMYKMDQLGDEYGCFKALAQIVNMSVYDNFGENLSYIHSRLSIAWAAHRDSHASSVRLALCSALVGCVALLDSLGVDADATVAMKMAYNESRPYKHGKAY